MSELGVVFHNPLLLQQALTHRSYLNEHPNEKAEHNERLEFLGDAVIGIVVAEWLIDQLPHESEGKLTRLRAGLVRRETLAVVARTLRLGEMMRVGRGEEENHGRQRERILCGVLEAICGALYLDRENSLTPVRIFILPHLTVPFQAMLRFETDKDPKSRLQEWSQSNLNVTPVYRVRQMTGPEHARAFTIEVVIGEQVFGEGSGPSKRSAEQAAARAAIDSLEIAED
jgi:ribonuclease-3